MAKQKYKRIYRAKKGAMFNHVKAQKYGDRIEQLAAEKGVAFSDVPTDAIIKDAKRKQSPLHSGFDWDVPSAALKYWRVQARNIMNHLVVVLPPKEKGEDAREVKVWESVVVREDTDEGPRRRKTYVRVDDIMTTPELLDQVVAQAYKELVYWKAKYEAYRNHPKIREIYEAIEAWATGLLPKRQIEALIKASFPKLKKNSSEFKSAIILIAAILVGTGVKDLAKYTGISSQFVSARQKRLMAAGIWEEDLPVYKWSLGELSSDAFWNDVCVAEGLK